MYLLTKVILAIMLGFISSALIGLIAIPLFKHFHIGQKTSIYTNHSSKEGTPTMGGLVFILSTLLVTVFLLITHKKRTMEYAKTLHGITMQESGISKLVSVRLEDKE